jgi:DNA-binding transcriptional ArsR family regulator
MDNLDRPNLGPQAYEEIDVALHEVDKTYWDKLRKMQVGLGFTINIFEAHPTPPKRPLRLRDILRSYAQELFSTEANEYPQHSQLQHWRLKLTERVSKRVMDSVQKIEDKGMTISTLDYHGLTQSQMRDIVDEALQEIIEAISRQLPEGLKLPSNNQMSDNETTISDQLEAVRNEAHLTVEQIAEKMGLAVRSVSRHLSGKAEPRPNNLRQYEKMFSHELRKPIRLRTSGKRPGKRKTSL